MKKWRQKSIGFCRLIIIVVYNVVKNLKSLYCTLINGRKERAMGQRESEGEERKKRDGDKQTKREWEGDGIKDMREELQNHTQLWNNWKFKLPQALDH